MNVKEVIELGGDLIPNPNYTKTNGQPKYIHSIYGASPDVMTKTIGQAGESFYDFSNDPLAQKVQDYGISPSKLESERGGYQNLLAEAQSGWKKAGNALAQTLVSEIGLGTLKGFSDLFDFIVGGSMRLATGEENDYTNPVSTILEQAQDDFRKYAPIYARDDVSLDNGGLWDSGWWFSNMPSIASSLTLLIPARGVTAGVGKLGSLAKATKFGKAANVSTRRWLGKVVGGQSRLNTAETLGRIGAEGTIMRIAENYQEARQVYSDLYPQTYQTLQNMSDEQYQAFVESRQDVLGDDLDYSDKSAVAKRISSYAADETFKSDMVNAVFDIYQLYGLRNIGKFMNAPSRASIRRLDKLSRKFPNKSKEELETMLNSRSTARKIWDATNDIARGSAVAITSELSEGVEEAVNYAAQEEGMKYGTALLSLGFDEKSGKYNLTEADKEYLNRGSFISTNRLLPFSRITQQALSDYIKAPALHDAAFWGVLGGVAFGAGGNIINKVSNKIKANSKKKELEKAGVDVSNAETLSQLLEEPELRARRNNIESRYTKFQELTNKVKSIKDGKDPFNPDRTLNTEEEKELARRRVIEDHDISLMLAAMDVGHWNITKAYLESDGVRDALVEAGVMSKSEAMARQQQIKALATKVEKLYNDNMKTIDNALSNGSYNGVDLLDVPLELYDIVARTNIAHQIAAERLGQDVSVLSAATSEEEHRVEKALNDLGFAVKPLITARVQAQALGQLKAERKALVSSKEGATLAGQATIQQLDKKIETVEDMLKKSIVDSRSEAIVVSALRLASGINKDISGEYFFNAEDKEFKKIDEAILNKDNTFFNKTYGKELNFDELGNEIQLVDNAYETLYNKNPNRVVASLSDISSELSELYHEVAAKELERVLEEGSIAITASDVAKEVDRINNTMTDLARPALLNYMLEGFQHLAKKYGSDNVIREVNLATKSKSKGQTYDSFNVDEKRFFNDAIKFMQLNKSVNAVLSERITKALKLNDIYEFTSTEDMFKPKPKQTQNSSASEKQSEQPITQKPNDISAQQIKTAEGSKNDDLEDLNDSDTPATAKDTKVRVSADINDNSVSGIKVDAVGNNDTGDDIFDTEETKNGDTVLKIKESPVIPDWILNSNLFVGTPTATSEIISNPVIRKTDAGIEIIEQGVIKEPIDSSTGGLAQTDKGKSLADDEDLAASAAEIESDDLGSDISNALIDYIGANDTFNFNDAASYLREQFEGVDKDRLEKFIENTINDPMYASIAEAAGRNVEAVPIAKAVAFSTLEDTIKTDEGKAYVRQALDATFKDILKNYANHSALDYDSSNGKYVLSMESLLRYATNVTDNKEDANRLYSILSSIAYNSDEYVVIDKTTPISELIENSKKTYEQRKAELADAHNATSINIKRYIGRLQDRLNDDISDDEKQSIERQLEDIYDALDNAVPGQPLIHIRQSGNNQTGIDFFITNSKGIDVKVGEIPTPESANGGTHWKMNNMGWITDIPKNDGISNFQNTINRILVPDENDALGNQINELLKSYIATQDKKLVKQIMDLVRSDDEMKQSVASRGYDSTRVNHLVDLYNYVKQVNDLFLQKYNLTREEADLALKDNRRESIQDWINKLKVSYASAEYIKTDDSIPIIIQSITSGSAIITQERIPVSKAIGSEHKGKVAIGIITFNNPGEITLSDGTSVPNNFGRPGYPILCIHGNHSSVAQIAVTTQTLNSDNFKNNQIIKNITKDVITELDKHIEEWGKTHDSTKLLDFVRRLVDRKYGNNTPLFQGIKVSPLTGGNEGFQLAYTGADNNVHYIKFFNTNSKDGNTYRVSNVEFVTKGQTTASRGISMLPTTRDKVARQQALDEIKKAFKEALKFNIDFAYVNSDNDSTLPVRGFATRKNGKFVININGTNEYEFNSFNDFVLDNDIINAGTEPNSHGSNFNRPGEGGFMDSNALTYSIADSAESSPVENNVEKDKTPYRKKGNEIQDIVSKHLSKTIFGELKADTKDNLSKQILNILLKDKQLNVLNKSGIINKLLHKNVIFVEDYNNLTYTNSKGETVKVPDTAKAAYHKESVKYTKPDGTEIIVAADTIVIGPNWIELANGTLAQQEQAARDIIHECVHRVLTFDENVGWIDKAQAILTDFKNAKLTDENDIKIRDVYSKLGLEEFLVESLTRPELMNVLNKIATDAPIGKKAKIKKGNLLQRVLKLVADLFGVNINENSLLEKEFNLFEELGKTAEQVEVKDNIEETKAAIDINSVTTTVNEGMEMEDIDFSTLNDVSISSKASVEQNLENEDRAWFDDAIKNGVVSIMCK